MLWVMKIAFSHPSAAPGMPVFLDEKGETNNKGKMKDVIVRTRSAGVFAGLLKSFENQTAVLTDARRLWYWSGAASLSQLSVEGVKNPTSCKFPIAVPEVTLPEVIEILPLSKVARTSIDSVKNWRA
jgi:small nuclear ribonucleoprotein (snRNP)-like protein